MKRGFDLVLALATMPLWLPLLGVAAVATFWVEGRPVFFIEPRIGLGGKTFRIVKLRSMREALSDEGKVLAEAERVTRWGAFLRRTSLDELPQFVHVLSGTMSFVGPRPLPERYRERYTRFEARRHEVRPGLTGWAQCHGRNSISWEKRFELDVWYVEHRSFWLDLKILGGTLNLLFRGIADGKRGDALMEELRPADRRVGSGWRGGEPTVAKSEGLKESG